MCLHPTAHTFEVKRALQESSLDICSSQILQPRAEMQNHCVISATERALV